jgi:hypothetical protein
MLPLNANTGYSMCICHSSRQCMQECSAPRYSSVFMSRKSPAASRIRLNSMQNCAQEAVSVQVTYDDDEKWTRCGNMRMHEMVVLHCFTHTHTHKKTVTHLMRTFNVWANILGLSGSHVRLRFPRLTACTSMNKSLCTCTLMILLRISDCKKTHTNRTSRFCCKCMYCVCVCVCVLVDSYVCQDISI